MSTKDLNTYIDTLGELSKRVLEEELVNQQEALKFYTRQHKDIEDNIFTTLARIELIKTKLSEYFYSDNKDPPF